MIAGAGRSTYRIFAIGMQHIATFTGHTAAIYILAHGTRPGHFLSSGGDGRIVEWDAARPGDGTLLATLPRPVFALLLAPAHGLLLAGTDTGGLHVIALREKREIQAYEVHTKGIFRIIPLSSDMLACAGGDGSISLWHTSSKGLKLVRQIPLADAKLRDLALAPDGNMLAVACGDGTVRVLETTSFNEVHTVHAHRGGATTLAFHPAKPVLLSGGKDGYLRAWHTDEDYRVILGSSAHAGTIYAIRSSPDGRWLASGGRDKAVKLWKAGDLSPGGTSRYPMDRPTRSVNTLLWSGDLLLTAGDDRTVHQWRAANG